MQASVEKIKTAREAIWLHEPADIGRLRTRKGARNQGASALLYAAMKLGQLVVFLNHLREVAKQGGVDLETMRRITEPLLEFYAKQYNGFYQLIDTAAIVRQGESALRGVRTLDEYAALVGELSLYVGRMDYWVDLEIPWPQFGEVFEQKRKG